MKLNNSNIAFRFNADFVNGSKSINLADSEIQVLWVSEPLQTLGMFNSLSGKDCDFCDLIKKNPENRQDVILAKYINKSIKHSIFQSYSILVDLKHHRHKDIEKVKDMLLMANDHKNMAVLCDGISYPDAEKKHFYLKLVHSKYFPLIDSIVHGNNLMSFFEGVKGSVFILDKSVRSAIVLKGQDLEWIFHVYLEIENILGRSYSLSKYPFINCFTYKHEKDYFLVVFPRVVHKPTEYYDRSSSQIKIIPGVFELIGLFITGDRLSFQNLNKDSIKRIFEQISYSFTNLMEIITPLKQKLKEEYSS
ncbi:hypothetical protein [Plebeiibacterium sediminum]|uniref:DUF4922 domain-containing protein n=1 Tax=Plebeiibacterium sediminum TaxID=2992112 RepID=A0AAE3M5I3_9BACT|nr:hypothetical protein [Plebeiobacterium sediminum]MCW3787242.1 DUF4922 domain-containing protein [Plebeiobacterium sediminum]